MLTALILVCSLAATPDIAACNQGNAVHVMHVPITVANPAMCVLQAQAYLAGTSIGSDLTPGEAVKVVCVRSQAGTVPPVPTRPATAEVQRSSR